jgi:hypothetical protein
MIFREARDLLGFQGGLMRNKISESFQELLSYLKKSWVVSSSPETNFYLIYKFI